MRNILKQAFWIVVVAAAAGLLVNIDLLVRCHRGEFERGFVSAAETESIVYVSGDQARDLWQSRSALFIDARPRGQYAAGHIPYAVNIPLSEPDKERLLARLTVDRMKPAIVYCGGGSCLDSLHLAQWLMSRKILLDVRVFQGGWQEWVDLGLPIEASRDSK